MADEPNTPPAELECMLARTRDLLTQGLDQHRAFSQASLELRLSQWPPAWGQDLHVLIYGDFRQPDADLSFPNLGITVHSKKVEGTIIRTGFCVLEATVAVSEKTIEGLIDASRRINILLGIWSLVDWGNAGCSWWSFVTHGGGAGTMPLFSSKDMHDAIDGLLSLPERVKTRLSAALYWIREPKAVFGEWHRNDVLRVYVGHWNAFELLVDAVNLLRPADRASPSDKQAAIDNFLAACQPRVTAAHIQQCYNEIVNPGLVGRASYALRVCFDTDADYYINECFRCEDRRDRLYDIRNLISHGDIDADSPLEIARVESRLHKLKMMIWGMFGRIIPFPRPLDPDLPSQRQQNHERV